MTGSTSPHLPSILVWLALLAVTSPAFGDEYVNGRGTWGFDPPEDAFTDDALLDLRFLNEPQAGANGFIGLSENGMSFTDTQGRPIRFWSVVSGVYRKKAEEMETHARFLAKLGVNMVRLHTAISPKGDDDKITDADRETIDRIWRFHAACKKNGIYLTISPYWPNAWHLRNAARHWNLAGYRGKNAEPWGLLFFNPRLQEAYKQWLEALYVPPNPYTGIPLKDDPAVAIIQIQNEDSLLFWTFQGIKEPQRKILRRRFAAWLEHRYPSAEKALEAWAPSRHEKDDVEAGEIGLLQTWDFTRGPGPDEPTGKQRRMADQLRFLAELQRGFYAEIGDYLRNELGCRQLINATNWRSADPILLDDVERWTYTANDVIAVNRYTGGMHVGNNHGYRIDPGHYLTNVSILRRPEKLPVAIKQVAGHPMIVTESSWTHPNRYQTEGPFLAAAYMSLTGVDSLYWFSAGEVTWLRDPRRMFWRVGDSHALDKWSCSVPQIMGQFPAAALAFRRGYIREADAPVVYEERSLENLWKRKVPIISEAGAFDPNRDKGDYAPESKIRQDVDRQAFLVGPVHAKYGGDERNSRVADLGAYIDRDAGVVRSVTSQIRLDDVTGLCTVDAPKFQGVCGFLRRAGGTFRLSDVTVRSGNEYATVMVTALDDKPLAASGRILVQVGTIARLDGWRTRSATFRSDKQQVTGEQIVATGKGPWRIADTNVSLTLRNAAISRATLLDAAGYRAETVGLRHVEGGVSVDLPAETMYLILD